MQANLRFAFVFLLVTASVSAVFAQTREITEEEFRRVDAQAGKLAYAGQYRSTMASRHFEKGLSTPSLEISELFERAGADKWRSLRIEKDSRGRRETESITIDRFVYSRSTGNPWVKKTVEESKQATGTFSVKGDVVKSQEKFTFSSLGQKSVNSEAFEVFESRKNRRYELGPNQYYEYTIIEQLWIDAKGRFAKRSSQNVDADGRLSIDTVWTYEYPAELQIKAPIK